MYSNHLYTFHQDETIAVFNVYVDALFSFSHCIVNQTMCNFYCLYCFVWYVCAMYVCKVAYIHAVASAVCLIKCVNFNALYLQFLSIDL